MRDQLALAQECLAVEERHESVMDYLKGRGFISPRATWERLQLNELGRDPKRITKGTCDMYKARATKEQWQQAIEMAINGQAPFEFLQECGYKDPTSAWAAYRARLKQQDPELLAKIPKFTKSGRQRKAEKMTEQKTEQKTVIKTAKIAEVFAEVDKAPAKPEPKITQPVSYDNMTVREVEGLFGRYRYSGVGNAVYIDFENSEGLDVISLTVDQWRRFREEQTKAFMILGVEL